MLVHPSDKWVLDFVVPSPNGPWFAGGAVLNWYQNRPAASDIDVFFHNEESYEKVKRHIDMVLHVNKNEVHDPFSDNPEATVLVGGKYEWRCITTGNAHTYVINDTKKLQVIKHRFYENPQSIVDNFDLSVCGIAYDGDRLYTSPHFVEDVAKKQFRFYKHDKHSLQRYVKYMAYGYRPVDGTLAELLENESVGYDRTESHYD